MTTDCLVILSYLALNEATILEPVGNRLIGVADFHAAAMVRIHQHDVERSMREHSRETPFSGGDRQLPGCVVPAERDFGIFALFIVIRIALRLRKA